MPELYLVRRWGSRPAGETVEVDDEQARFLLGTAYAVRPGDEDGHRGGTGRVHPGGEGADPRAGGDPTRLRLTSSPKSPRGGERAGRVAGAPRAVGDVSHVASENLGKEHKGDKGDVLLASGKTLRQDLEEQQREIEKRDAERKSSDEQPQGGGPTVTTQSGPTASGQSPRDEGEGPGRVLSQPKRN